MNRPILTLIIPVYNEELILRRNLNELISYLTEIPYEYEIIIVDDGSSDSTGEIIDQYAASNKRIIAIHHPVNMQLGSSIKTGIEHAKGQYIITYDIDMSYSMDHIERMIETIISTESDVVIASPYMKGGSVKNVPIIRRVVSRIVNLYMRFFSQQTIHTFTGMVRCYRSKFIKSLVLRSVDYEINPEILYKAMLLRARIVEIPAHLEWKYRQTIDKRKVSFTRVFKGILPALMSGFILRPYVLFLSIGTFLFMVALYLITWILINTMKIYPTIEATSSYFDDRFSNAIAAVFQARPHAFLIGGFVLVVALQFISMGFLSLQNKRYYEELYDLGTRQYKFHESQDD